MRKAKNNPACINKKGFCSGNVHHVANLQQTKEDNGLVYCIRCGNVWSGEDGKESWPWDLFELINGG